MVAADYSQILGHAQKHFAIFVADGHPDYILILWKTPPYTAGRVERIDQPLEVCPSLCTTSADGA